MVIFRRRNVALLKIQHSREDDFVPPGVPLNVLESKHSAQDNDLHVRGFYPSCEGEIGPGARSVDRPICLFPPDLPAFEVSSQLRSTLRCEFVPDEVEPKTFQMLHDFGGISGCYRDPDVIRLEASGGGYFNFLYQC